MSMIKCSECGKDVSDKAKECVHCGNPLEKINKDLNKKSNKSNKIIAIIIFSILAIYCTFGIVLNFIRGTDFSNTGAFTSLIIFSVVIITSLYFIIKNIKALKRKKLEKTNTSKKTKAIILFVIMGIVVIGFILFGFNKYSDYTEKQELIGKIKEYQNNGYLELSNEEYQKLETSSNFEIKERLDKIEDNIEFQTECNKKYSAILDDIYNKQLRVQLLQGEDANFVYFPATNSSTKVKLEYVVIETSEVISIYYSVETQLTAYSKYNSKPITQTVTKFYKTQSLDEVIQIDNYNDSVIVTELDNIFEGKVNSLVVRPSQDKPYKYNFVNFYEANK